MFAWIPDILHGISQSVVVSHGPDVVVVYGPKRYIALMLDEQDSLKSFRTEFHIPIKNGKTTLYFTGNSLGLQPKRTQRFMQ